MRSNFNSLLVVLAILDIGVVVTGIWYNAHILSTILSENWFKAVV